MNKYLITLKPAPNDHKIGRAQLSATLDDMGIPHRITEIWHFGNTKAVISLFPKDVTKLENKDTVSSIVLM
jgi:hypothetical protein